MPYQVDVGSDGITAHWIGLVARIHGRALRDAAETSRVLRAARGLLAEWTPGASSTSTGFICDAGDEGLRRVCLLDALELAAPSFAARIEAEVFLASLVGSLAAFEASPGRTQADVLALVDRAILRAAALGRSRHVS